MKINRIEKDGKIAWQAILTDDEMANIIHCVVTGILGNALKPVCRTMAEGIIDSLMEDASQDTPELKRMMEHVRQSHAPGRFVIDVTTLVRENLKDDTNETWHSRPLLGETGLHLL